jgi:uncharacterized protein YybS (DUF2232 family)
MKMKNISPTAMISIFFILLFWLNVSNNQRFIKTVTDNDKKTRDSLSKKMLILAAQSDSLSRQIKLMTENLTADRLKLTTELNKIRNEKPPVINYHYYTDSAIIGRLSGR